MFYALLHVKKEKPTRYGSKGEFCKWVQKDPSVFIHITSDVEDLVDHVHSKEDRIFIFPDDEDWLLSEPAWYTLLCEIYRMKQEDSGLVAGKLIEQQVG